ncbi:MAG: sporulation protein YabP [Ruminococcus sp.]|jgi:sporulation protein YabP|nr:sporulation protein YabP [Ruminococcus sp.]
MYDKSQKPHSLILDNRSNLSLTGVNDVLGFNEETVNLKTNMGDLVIRGSSLHISKLDLDSGNVEIDGTINLLNYSQSKSDKSFFQRLFS